METIYIRETFEYEEDFRNFRKQVQADVERGFQQERENLNSQQEAEARVSGQIRELLKGINPDTNRLEAIEKAEAKQLEGYMERVRPSLIERDPQFDVRLRQDLDFELSYSPANSSQAHLIGADVVALDHEKLSTYEGEAGNPGKWLYDANKNWKGKISQTGSAGCSGGTPYHPLGTIFYFIWTPPKIGKYWIISRTAYHGYYLVYSLLMPWSTCNYASVKGVSEVRVGVKKSSSLPPQAIAYDTNNIFSKGGSSIVANGTLDGSTFHSFEVNYTGSGPLYFNLIQSWSITAKGSPTYAEVNFQDGSANYIGPPVVAISWT